MNEVKLVGTYSEKEGCVRCKRFSDNYDSIPLVFRDGEKVNDNERLAFWGSIKNDEGKVYVSVAEAHSVGPDSDSEPDTTQCELQGYVKKIYPVRTTKKERQLQDMLIEADGEIIKVVAFEPYPDFVKLGFEVKVFGRLQERSFTQVKTFSTEERTVYEVALRHLKVIKNGQGNEN